MKPRAIDWVIAAAIGLLLSWMAADGAAEDTSTESTLPATYIVTANQ